MDLDHCIAHAIHKDLDIIEALPEIQELPVQDLENYVENYVIRMQAFLSVEVRAAFSNNQIPKTGRELAKKIKNSDLPPQMLINMCDTIISMHNIDARFVLDTENGTSLYDIRMEVFVGDGEDVPAVYKSAFTSYKDPFK